MVAVWADSQITLAAPMVECLAAHRVGSPTGMWLGCQPLAMQALRPSPYTEFADTLSASCRPLYTALRKGSVAVAMSFLALHGVGGGGWGAGAGDTGRLAGAAPGRQAGKACTAAFS